MQTTGKDNTITEMALPYQKGVIDSGYYNGSFVYYRKVNSFAIIGGDVAVPVDSIKKSLVIGKVDGAIRSDASKIWTYNIVYYVIDPSLSSTDPRIINAIQHWENNSSLTFIERTTEPNYITFYFEDDNLGVFSTSIGMAGGEQEIHIPTLATTGNTIHEIGHAVGLFHEHTRTDRNNFVIVNTANIGPNAMSNFYRYIDLGFNGADIGIELDFNSVMMYPSFAFSINGLPTITRLDGSTFTTQRNGLSLFDRVASHWANPFNVNGNGNEGEGAGVACYDVNGNGIPDLFMMCNDAPSGLNNFHYRVGFDINTNGRSTNWSTNKVVTGLGNTADGADIAIALIDNNNIPDIILMHYDDPTGMNSFRYKIGYNLNSSGDATSWSSTITVSGLGNDAEGDGMTFSDINNDGLLDIVLMAYDAATGANNFRYKIGYSVNSSGVAQSWSSTQIISGLGDFGNGAGITFSDFDNNGVKDILLMAYDNPSGFNSFRYKVGLNINSSGVPQQWLTESIVRGVGDMGQG